MNRENLSIIGVGYVGLCSAVVFASKGYKVIASDTDTKKVEKIKMGQPTFHEPRLDKLLRASLEKGNFECTTDKKYALLNSEITFVTTGTPCRKDGGINLASVIDSSREIGEILKIKKDYHLVIIKSTVTPGTTENMVKPIIEKKSEKRCGVNFGLCMNPEFLREGSAIHDMFNPDRIIVGEFDEKSGSTLNHFYQNFYSFKIPILKVNLSTAEMIKYANNSFLATKISFINQIANICQKIPGSDITKIAEALGLDRRINPNFLRAGLGYGGSCFPKDLDALLKYAKNLNINVNLLEAVKKINNKQPYVAVELTKLFLKKLKNKKISILGLSFKPGTDDLRNAVSIKIIKKLIGEEAIITVYDPVATLKAKEIFNEKINYVNSSIECIKNSDCCILVTEWEEFRNLTPEFYLKNMNNPILIDGRRLYDPNIFAKKLKYMAVGLG